MKSTTLLRRLCSPRTRLLCGVMIPLIGAASAQPAHVQLPAPAHGRSAIVALGDKLPDVAKAYGLEAQQLVALFETQPSLGVDIEGALLHACEGLAVPEHGSLVDEHGKPTNKLDSKSEDALTSNSSVTVLASGGTVDAFKLHSLPGVTRVIYLDFDGHTTTGTSWNTSYSAGAPIVSGPINLDGDPSTFSSSERTLIQRIWQRVAEDYAPFGVDVTTEDPGIEGLRRTTSSDMAYGIRVVISPTNWYKTTAGGVAYVGSFSAATDTPCFAFTEQLANAEKYIAEAVSHEAGHTVGLHHDGTSATGYYQGQGNWAPIMGVGYYKAVAQFSKGEYADANNLQDDLTVIATYIPVAADDHGNTTATASALNGPNVANGGTIETRSDVDVFRLDSNAGTISLAIAGPSPQPNVDIKAELLNSAGAVLQTSDSATALSATINATVSAGTYYLRIDGVGLGDPVTTGYSDYGSIGNYIITGSFPTSGTKQAPVAVATASALSGVAPLTVNFSGLNSKDADGTIASYHWAFGTGDGAAGMDAGFTYTTPGTYSAVLTVVDNDGLAGTASAIITVSAPTNVPPVAVAGASTTSGMAPVPVMFFADGSRDPDGTITSYKWEFGDGTSSITASAPKTYSNPGKYTAKLTVTDDRGASSSSTVDVSVLGDPAKDADVYSFALSFRKEKSGTTASAVITVLDRSSNPVSGATITVQWSGVASGSSSGKTDTAGRVTFTSPRTKKSGVETAKITSVTPPAGSAYVSIFGVSLSQSITLP
jgi:PKD repeat protein